MIFGKNQEIETIKSFTTKGIIFGFFVINARGNIISFCGPNLFVPNR
jgi:hypothetical protein